IWRLPGKDSEYSKRWSAIKRYFSIACNNAIDEIPESRRNKREKAVWQRRFWEHTIKSEEDWQNHMDYIHYNPVKHGLVSKVKDWPYSSFSKFVEKGYYSEEWASTEPDNIKSLSFE
ncbi:MAG TPA: transposase, partial [Gammaproteobacteria bacterium]|nr:transposase [Gammaproteobacteria bacterium]